MLRLNRALRLALPFEPMALTTLDMLESKLAQTSSAASLVKGGERLPPAVLQDSYHWFESERSRAPFFLSPKHDGIRVVSYVPPSAHSPYAPLAHPESGGGDTGPSKVAKQRSGKAGLSPNPPIATTTTAVTTTTYSRHGRALYGMFWLEKELALVRALARDPYLVLDGELYIHRSAATTAATEQASTTTKKPSRGAAAAQGVVRGGRRRLPSREALAEGRDGFKTGFLAVNALVHRLRGSSSQCATVADIMQYVATLPHYCVFDVAAYNPAGPTPSTTPVCSREAAHYGGQVAAELARVRAEVLQRLGLPDLESLRCTPNLTPFSQRLRTLHFLMETLARGVRSTVLQAAFSVHAAAEVAAAGAAVHPPYRGGVFVRRIPYEVVGSVEVAKTRLLSRCEQQGYEGAVIRTPMNTYAMREKRKGVVRSLVAPMVSALTSADGVSSPASGGGRKGRGRAGRKGVAHAARKGKEERRGPAPSPVHAADDSALMAEAAIDVARHLPRRSETAVKLLPFKDKEYPVLRPLLKEPSTNPRTRPLLTVPLSWVDPSRDRTLIKRDPATARGTVAGARRGSGAGEEMVVFYGLQCLAENGKVFNVTMPKLSMEKQRELLQHLLPSTNPRNSTGGGVGRGKAAHRERRGKSLTGTYVTVKFSSLTEHGVPRFAQVKAIRGGKGWHM